ncbi:MAG: L-threonylcarbamoyladenylate synthase [Anaerolineae bacterium]|nr:L-threonylcarbamoyladenylate synthase [Anaerolineae bacterium]
MVTEIIGASHPSALRRASEVVRAGGVVAFPTDTVYGLGATPWLDSAVRGLYAIKERPDSKAIPLLLSSADHLERVAALVPSCRQVIKAFWPGGLTLILPKTMSVSEVVSDGPSVAVRVPDLALARELIEVAGGVLAVTSANVSGQPSSVTATDVYDQLGGRIELIIDGGPCRHGISSTILDCTLTPPIMRRRGAVSEAALRSVLGQFETVAGE